MYSYVARQPIFDDKKQLFGYELLFRDSDSAFFPDIDADQATLRLLLENYLTSDVAFSFDDHRMFINFPQQLLLSEYPKLLPKSKVVIEILETCSPTPELLNAVKELHHLGYTLALDDFDCNCDWIEFFPYIHIIKVDLLIVSQQKVARFIQKYQSDDVLFLAEKVENQSVYLWAKSVGFHLFQGYYFGYPTVSKTRMITPQRLIMLQLLNEVCQSTIDFKKLENIVMEDVSLSFLLLRYVNLYHSQTSVSIRNFEQALLCLGEDRLRIFIAMIGAASMNFSQPKETFSKSLQRAKMLQLLVEKTALSVHSKQAFLIGMFSTLDQLLGNTLPSLLSMLPLDDETLKAVLYHQGELGVLLGMVLAWEQDKLTEVNKVCQQFNLSSKFIEECYATAVIWEGKYSEFDGVLEIEIRS